MTALSVSPQRPIAEAQAAFALKRSQMPRALLAQVVLLVAAASLSGCGLFKFGTLEFLPGDGSTSMEPEDLRTDAQDLGTPTTDGPLSPDMPCMATEQPLVVNKNDVCWDANKMQATEFMLSTMEQVPCLLEYKLIGVPANTMMALKVEYTIEFSKTMGTTMPQKYTPHIIGRQSRSDAAIFDHMPNPNQGRHETEIRFRTTEDSLNLSLDFRGKPSNIPQNWIKGWTINRINLSSECPR